MVIVVDDDGTTDTVEIDATDGPHHPRRLGPTSSRFLPRNMMGKPT
jgi:hypothetical protein